MMNRIVALMWGGATLFIGYLAISAALGPKGDASGWVMVAVFAGMAGFCAWQMWRDWNAPDPQRHVSPAPAAGRQHAPEPVNDAPGAWRGLDIPLETQISQLKEAGLVLAPGRTMEELLVSWPRSAFEKDPYGLLLFMYGVEVEAEPWGRFFCDRGWNFDMECLVETGDYVRAFTQLVRITGQPHLVTGLRDDFNMDNAAANISYTLNGRPRAIKARIDSDWADPKAVAAFMRDIEGAVADGRHFWAADNGQSSILFFLNDAEAARINALREDTLQRYTLP